MYHTPPKIDGLKFLDLFCRYRLVFGCYIVIEYCYNVIEICGLVIFHLYQIMYGC
jgi:hypothetical protein